MQEEKERFFGKILIVGNPNDFIGLNDIVQLILLVGYFTPLKALRIVNSTFLDYQFFNSVSPFLEFINKL